MTDTLAANWPLALIALLIALVLAWFIFQATRRTRVVTDRRDTLDEGAAPAARNQALIDAPPVAVRDPAPPAPLTPEAVAGAGAAVAVAVEEARHAATVAPPPAPAPGGTDDLTQIKGVGPKLAAQLGSLGVTRFAEIAAWSDADIERIDSQLGRFQGRIRRDDWVAQAQLLAAGDLAAFRARFGAS